MSTTLPASVKTLYSLPGDEWKVVCDAMAYGAWFALHDERTHTRNEGQIFGVSRKLIEERYRRYLQQGRILMNDFHLFMHYFQPNFRDCYQSVLTLSDDEYTATKTMMQVTFGDSTRLQVEQYRRIYGDRAQHIITKEHNRFML